MNLANFTFQSFRFILLPVSVIYGLIIHIRNIMYDKGWLTSTSFNLPVICVGNLSVGGTGKSPMIEVLINYLSPKYEIATLSRGYKRKTKGYLLASAKTTALEIGDEPMAFYQKYPHISVAVGEERITAIPQLLQDKPETEVILLDDAFQHRSIKAGLSLLLTDFSDLFTRDFFLPTGNLRDAKSSYKRAEIIVVTKCDPNLSTNIKVKITKEINPMPDQSIFFATMLYDKPYHILSKECIDIDPQTEVLLVTGIANIKPIKQLLDEQAHSYDQLTFSDHHIFNIDDMTDIKSRFIKLKGKKNIILTTEKDAMRLIKFKDQLEELPVYILPVKHKILFDEELMFMGRINDFIKSFKTKSIK